MSTKTIVLPLQYAKPYRYRGGDTMNIFDMTNRIGNSDSIRLYEEMTKMQIGDILLFGSYYLPGTADPNDARVKCPIDWQVIDKSADRIMLLSRHSLFWTFYDGRTPLWGPPPKTSWEKSTIREELNNECLESWFSISEQSLIIEHVQAMDENPVFRTLSGDNTIDRLFLLSLDEANRYLGVNRNYTKDPKLRKNSEACTCMIMADFVMNKERCREIELFPDFAPWWLRTSGMDAQHIICINEDGSADFEGMESSADEVGIRPAMWIDLSRLQTDEENELPYGEGDDDLPFC